MVAGDIGNRIGRSTGLRFNTRQFQLWMERVIGHIPRSRKFYARSKKRTCVVWTLHGSAQHFSLFSAASQHIYQCS